MFASDYSFVLIFKARTQEFHAVITEISGRHRYPYEALRVTTEDGYILLERESQGMSQELGLILDCQGLKYETLLFTPRGGEIQQA